MISCADVTMFWQRYTCEMFFQEREHHKMLPLGEILSYCSQQAEWLRLRHNVELIQNNNQFTSETILKSRHTLCSENTDLL